MSNAAGSDWMGLLRAVFALLFVVGLIYSIGGMARKYDWAARMAGGVKTGKKARRIRLEETLYLDPKRRVVLIACDGREHLLLLGAGSDVVIASRQGGDAHAQ